MMYKLVVKIKRIKGDCNVHKVGDFFEIKDDAIYIPQGEHICTWSLSSLLPFISACQREITEPSDWLPSVKLIHCP
ncbi:MAG: TIGR04076 family protein, partial [Promethearchaeota archaeon]